MTVLLLYLENKSIVLIAKDTNSLHSTLGWSYHEHRLWYLKYRTTLMVKQWMDFKGCSENLTTGHAKF